MKRVNVTVQFVIEMDVWNDTDLEKMERSIEARPVKFVHESFEADAASDWVHVAVEPAE